MRRSTFDTAKLSPEIKKAVEEGMADAWKEFAEYKKTQIDTGKRTSADGFGTREFLKNDYIDRMAAAVLGIYGNSKEEAIYPVYFVDSDGEKLDASKNRYTLHFRRISCRRSMPSGRSRCTSCRRACSSRIRSTAISSTRRCCRT